MKNIVTEKVWLARFSAIALLLLQASCMTSPTVRSGHVVVGDENTRVSVIFSDRDRAVIDDYYGGYHHGKHKSRGRGKGLPPGLAKREQLPPGLQKQIQRNGALPPGLQRDALPGELEELLSPLPYGYVRFRVGGDIVLMEQNTRIMVDVIKSIVP